MAETLQQMARRLCKNHNCIECPVREQRNCIVLRLCEYENVDKDIEILKKWAIENPPEPPKTWLSEARRLLPWYTDDQLICYKCPRLFFPWMKTCGLWNTGTSKCVACWNQPYVERGEDDANGEC